MRYPLFTGHDISIMKICYLKFIENARLDSKIFHQFFNRFSKVSFVNFRSQKQRKRLNLWCFGTREVINLSFIHSFVV